MTSTDAGHRDASGELQPPIKLTPLARAPSPPVQSPSSPNTPPPPQLMALQVLKMAKKQSETIVTRQRVTTHKHKKSILISIVIYCSITICLWLPLQVLVYYRAFRKTDSVSFWISKPPAKVHLLPYTTSPCPSGTTKSNFSPNFSAHSTRQSIRS